MRRTALHGALEKAVRDAGVVLVEGHVGDVRQDASGVQAGGVRARYLVAADGLHSGIRSAVGLSRAGTRPARYGLRRHFAVPPWSDLVEVTWSRCSEAYVTPVGPDLVGVAILTHERGSFADHLRAFPALAERLPDAAATAVRGAGPLRQRTSGQVAGRVLLVGDAAGYVDALTGEGIAMGLRTAKAAVACIAANRPLHYERAWREITREYRLLTQTLVQTTRVPLVRRNLVAAAAATPWLFDAAIRSLAR
jgi:flavin-dependent dehydrogenase